MAVMTITNTSQNKDFLFLSGELKAMGDQTNVLSVSITFPSDDRDDPDDSFNMSLGEENLYTFQFKLYTQTIDRSNGTDSSIKTFQEIIPYLKSKKMFFTGVGEVLYRVQLTTKFETIDGLFELQDFKINTDSGLYPSGSIKMKYRGKYET